LVPKGDAVRPATDGLRQAVFSSIAPWVGGARFLDLFAGSGAYGLEALSRGAASGIFLEKSAKAADCLRQNLAAVCKSLGRGGENLEIRQADALTAPLDADGAPPALVFVDPPYEIIADVAPRLFARFDQLLASEADALVVFEMPGEITLAPAGWSCRKRLGKGARQPTVCFFQKADRNTDASPTA
jgi:16S rRNA (guanine966-N2)-methyltransferase